MEIRDSNKPDMKLSVREMKLEEGGVVIDYFHHVPSKEHTCTCMYCARNSGIGGEVDPSAGKFSTL